MTRGTAYRISSMTCTGPVWANLPHTDREKRDFKKAYFGDAVFRSAAGCEKVAIRVVAKYQ